MRVTFISVDMDDGEDTTVHTTRMSPSHVLTNTYSKLQVTLPSSTFVVYSVMSWEAECNLGAARNLF